MHEQIVRVETYSGFKADERPLRLHLRDVLPCVNQRRRPLCPPAHGGSRPVDSDRLPGSNPIDIKITRSV